MNTPSPYFIRRAAPPEDEFIELADYMEVEEERFPLREYGLVLKRRRWLIIACVVVAALAAALYTFTRVPIYTARATLLIERKPPQVLKIQDALSESIEHAEFYKTQHEILKSRALAGRVILNEGLDERDFSAGAAKPSGEGFVSGLWSQAREWVAQFFPAANEAVAPRPADDRRGLVGGYLSMLEILPVRGTGLVQVAFSTPDPAVSARLANLHAASYIRYGVDLRSRTNEEALGFLEKKLLELKERVQNSEAALNSYRRDKGIISLDDKENVIVDRLVDLNKRLTAAEADRINLEAQVRVIRGGDYDSLPAVATSAIIQGLKNEIRRLENEHLQLAKEFKPGYPPLDRVKVQLDNSRRRMQTEIQNEVQSIQSAYQTALAREEEFRAKLQEQKTVTLRLKDSAVDYAILAREVDTNRQLYDSVLQRMKEMGVAAEVKTSNVYLLEKAEIPFAPSYPNKRRSLLLGLLMGLAGGIGLAFLLERLDNTFKSPEELERYTRLPNLGVVPDFNRLTGKGYGYGTAALNGVQGNGAGVPAKISHKDVILSHHPFSVVAEAYRTLRSTLLLSRAGEPARTVLLTSATRGEGKTTTLVNTAIVFAQMGARVLIIDGDLRRPRCHRLLDIESGAGLAEVLAGHLEPEKAVRSTPAENLFMITSGASVPNSAELLGSKKMAETLGRLREEYDYVFIDSSPVLAVSDAVLLATMVEGVVLVVDGQKTPKQLVRDARSRLNNPQTKILGALLNRVDARNGAYAAYYSHYYQYYGKDHDEA